MLSTEKHRKVLIVVTLVLVCVFSPGTPYLKYFLGKLALLAYPLHDKGESPIQLSRKMH